MKHPETAISKQRVEVVHGHSVARENLFNASEATCLVHYLLNGCCTNTRSKTVCVCVCELSKVVFGLSM